MTQKKNSRNNRELLRTLNKIVRMENFQDDFYRKPLEQMLELSDDAVRVLTQLKTTVQSYDSLMEKLEVDISVVEREKERITELLEDYVREIHSNPASGLGRKCRALPSASGRLY